jgi:serine/threonine-protein kinase
VPSQDQRTCPTCGHSLTDGEALCPFDHALEGGVLGLPRSVIEATPRPHRHLLGVALGGYRINGFLGAGGFGAVYRAEQVALHRPVALKILGLENTLDSSAVMRFKREARTAANLLDPNIVTLFDFGQAIIGGGTLESLNHPEDDWSDQAPSDSVFGNLSTERGDRVIYMAMELVEGPTLQQIIKDTGGVRLSVAMTLGVNILRGLAAAHAQGVVHRDLKPTNVVIDTTKHRSHFARLIDFGIASLQDNHTTLRQGAGLLGTPKYMAPEQWDAQSPTPGTDVYAFGAILVELLTGEPAVPFGDTIKMARAHKAGLNPALAHAASGEPVPPALAAFIRRCLAVEPQQRFASAREALEAFTTICQADDTPDEATPNPLDAWAATADQAVLTLDPPQPQKMQPVKKPNEPADDAWLESWSESVEGTEVKHLPGDAHAISAALSPQGSDAEFSYGSAKVEVPALEPVAPRPDTISVPPAPAAAPSAARTAPVLPPGGMPLPGPVADSAKDDSWGVAGAEMTEGAADRPIGVFGSARKPSARGPLNLWAIVGVLVLVVGGLVIWRLVAREDAVAESMANSNIKPSTQLRADQLPAAPPSQAPATVASPDAGLSKAESVLVLVQPAGTFIRASDKQVLCETADACRLAVDGEIHIERPGYEQRVLTEDDLFDRKGGRWKLKLRDIQK